MLGWIRKKDKPTTDSGLLYTGARAAPPKPRDPGPILHTYETNEGPLEMRENSMVLATPEGDIIIPYHAIQAWDDDGKAFKVWWDTGRPPGAVKGFVPKLPAKEIGVELARVIHDRTFG